MLLSVLDNVGICLLIWFSAMLGLFSVYLCNGSIVVTAYDSESGRPGSNPEWGEIYYEALITAQGLPKPSSLRGSTLGTRAAEHKGCNWACKLIDGCSLALCSATGSVVSSGICHRNKVNSTAWLYRDGPSHKIVSFTLHYITNLLHRTPPDKIISWVHPCQPCQLNKLSW